jgi:hydroxymethylbilane synthase
LILESLWMKSLIVATRGGALAVAQTRSVIAELEKRNPGIKIEIKKVTTSGDADRRTELWNLKDTGFFTSQIEDCLLAGEADFAVHSFKDLPTAQREGLTIAAVFNRTFVEDCLVAKEHITSLAQLAPAAKIGTSSLRRIAQVRHVRPDLQTIAIRGNVETRLKKLNAGQFDAIILARAGLERLGLANRISFIFAPTEFIPAPAQGALAIQSRADDKETCELIASLDDISARITTSAERQILTELQCGCHAPVGVYATIEADEITICAFISDTQGKNFIRQTITGPIKKSESLAKELANELLAAGGKGILMDL